MTFLDLVLIALAGWRFAYLITSEDGPGNVMGRLRLKAKQHSRHYVAWPDGGTILENPEPPAGSVEKLVTCFRCSSVWGAALAWVILQTPLRGIIWIAAGSAAAILVSEYVGMGFSHDSNS